MNVSHQQIFWRLMWKEYRSQRGLWIGVAALAVFVQAVMLAVLGEREIIGSLYGVAWLLPILYALGSSAVLFAAEKEDGTYELLRTLPVTPLRLFVGKMSFCLTTCVAMILLLNALAWVLASGRVPAVEFRDFANLAEFFPAVLVVGVFYSLMMGRVLNVIVATIVTVLVLNLNDMHLFKWTGIVAFLVADGVLVRRWFLDGSLVQERAGHVVDRIAGSLPFPRSKALAKADTSPAWWRTWKRSLWLEYRHARRTIFVWFPLAAVLVFVSPWTYRFIGIDFTYIIMPLAPLFLGLSVFRGHQHDGRIRFLSERGVPPQLVWVNCQIIWGSLLCVLLLGVWVGLPYFRHQGGGVFGQLVSRAVQFSGIDSHDPRFDRYFNFVRSHGFMLGDDFHEYWHEVINNEFANRSIRFFAWWGILSFLAGQLCSLKFSRAVAATTIGFVLAALACFWLSLMEGLPVPFWLSIVPVILFWIVLSYAGVLRWSLGNSTWKTKLRTTVIFAGYHATVLLAVICFRIQEVPANETAEAWVAEFTGANAPVNSQPGDAEMSYAKVDSLIEHSRPSASTEIRKQFKDDPQGLARADAAWFEAHQAALPALIEAIDAGTIPNLTNLSPGVAERSKDLMLASADYLTAEGRLDDALTRFEDALQFTSLVAMTDQKFVGRPNSYEMHWWYGLLTQNEIYSHLVKWASHPDQTPTRIRRAISMLAEQHAAYPTIEQAWQVEYRQMREDALDSFAVRKGMFLRVFVSLPWERRRLLRLLDDEAFEMLQRYARIRDKGVLTHPRWKIDWSRILYDLQFTRSFSHDVLPYARDGIAIWELGSIRSGFHRLLETQIRHETHYRATRLRLELMALRLERGELPSQLTATLPTLDPVDLIDPWSGEEFGWYPRGIPHRFRGAESTDILHNQLVETGTPFLWGVSRENRSLIAEKSADGTSVDYLAVRSGEDYIYKYDRDEPFETSRLYGHEGLFPIPSN